MNNKIARLNRVIRVVAAAVVALMAAGAVSSCSDGGRDYSNSDVISIGKKALKTVESYDLYNTFKSVEIIPLETTSESLFAGVKQAIVNGSDIYVLAEITKNGSDAKIMHFKNDGTFVRQIGSLGEGPGEYLMIDNIILSNDTIFAFDSWFDCVHAYDAATGKHLVSSTKEAYEPTKAMSSVIRNPVRNNFLFTGQVMFGDDRFELAEGDPMTGAFNILLPQRFSVDGWIAYDYGMTTICDLDGRNAVAILPLNNTVYRIDYATCEATPFCKLFPEEKMPEFKPMENYEVAQNAVRDANVLWPVNIFATKDYLTVSRIVGSVVWNIGTSEGYFTGNGWSAKDATEFPFFPSDVVGTIAKTNTFICEYDAESFMEYRTAIHENHPYQLKEHNTGELTEDSNPVLVLYTLK